VFALKSESGRRFRLQATAALGNNGTAPPTIQTLVQAKRAVGYATRQAAEESDQEYMCLTEVQVVEWLMKRLKIA
jgi:hypothetical protein